MGSSRDPPPNFSRDGHFYTNPSAQTWTSHYTVDPRVEAFHRTLPGYAPTPLTPLPSVAQRMGVGHVLIKDESARFQLPAFKILGASWATCRAVSERLGLPVTVSLEELRQAAKLRHVELFAASEGNHGRAVARMAQWLSIRSHILVPKNMDQATQERIAGEGAEVEVVDGDYDLAVEIADRRASASNGLLIQDNAWPGYELIPTVRYVPSSLPGKVC